MSGKGSEAAAAAATTAGLVGFRPFVEAMPDGIVIADTDGRILYVNHLAEELCGYPREELVGLTVEMLMAERFRGAHLEHRTGFASTPHPRAMGSGLALHLLRKDGVELPVDIALSPIETEVGVIIVTAIRVASDRAPRNADVGGRAVDRLQAMADVMSALLEGQTVDQALQLIARAARSLVGAANAGVLIPESPGGAMVIRAFDAAEKYQALVGLRVTGDSIAARVMRRARTTVMADAASDEKLQFRELVADLGPVLCVPLIAGGRPVGVISLTRTRGTGAYTPADVSLAEAFAAQAAVVVEYGRNLAERRKAERRVAAGMEVTQAIIEGRDTNDVLQLIAARARPGRGGSRGHRLA